MSPEEKEPKMFNFSSFVILFFGMNWVGLFPSIMIGYWFFRTFPFSFTPLYLLLMENYILKVWRLEKMSFLVAMLTSSRVWKLLMNLLLELQHGSGKIENVLVVHYILASLLLNYRSNLLIEQWAQRKNMWIRSKSC